MKTIHNINKWSFIITLLLYTTVVLGLLSQILLGSIQVIIAMIIFSNWKEHTSRVKTHLLMYFGLVTLYGVSWLLGIQKLFHTNSMVMDPIIVYICIIPMSIAAYSVYITYETKKSKNELKLSHI